MIGSEFSNFDDNLGFGFAFSTPLLLLMLANFKTICIDATYKLNWMGFPLVVLGTVDRANHFHPFVYACVSHERAFDYEFVLRCVQNAIKNHFSKDFSPTTIIADGADAIRNAFYTVFDSAQLDVMCFAHVIRNCRKRPFASKSNKNLILADIKLMQLAPNRPTFTMMANLFAEKWDEVEPDFVQYFRKEWLGVHANWYEGAAIFTPSTNNGLESHNAVIKRSITLRRRLPMNEFLVTMKEMATNISKSFSNGQRVIATEPEIKRETYENAILMVKDKFKAFKQSKRKTQILAYFLYHQVNAMSKTQAKHITKLWLKQLGQRSTSSLFMVSSNFISFISRQVHGKPNLPVRVQRFSKNTCASM